MGRWIEGKQADTAQMLTFVELRSRAQWLQLTPFFFVPENLHHQDLKGLESIQVIK